MAESVAARHIVCHPEIIPDLAFTPPADYDCRHFGTRGKRHAQINFCPPLVPQPSSPLSTAATFTAADPVRPRLRAAAPAASGPDHGPIPRTGALRQARIETDTNIVYATVPRVPNPSAEASPNPGTPNGIRAAVPNTGPAGTMDLHLDVYQVASDKPTPVVLQLHGGGWIFVAIAPPVPAASDPFFAAGMSVVAIQYRNAIDAPAPGAIQDVRCAMAWIKANAKKYNFDPDKVVPWGGSAGGHLALMAGYAPASMNPPGCTDQPKVAAIIDMYGASDVASALTYPGSRDFTHQWIGLDLHTAATPPPAPLPRQPLATTAPAAAGSAEPANPDGMPRPRRVAPRWPDPTRGRPRPCPRGVATHLHPSRPARPPSSSTATSDHTYEPTQSYIGSRPRSMPPTSRLWRTSSSAAATATSLPPKTRRAPSSGCSSSTTTAFSKRPPSRTFRFCTYLCFCRFGLAAAFRPLITQPSPAGFSPGS